jgi:prepilin peptidase CpaA
MTLPELLVLLALSCLLAAAVSDVTRFEIPDGISVALTVLAIGFGLAVPGFPWLWHAAAMLAMFAAGAGLFAIGWMGGGDVKLLTATAAWVGLKGLVLQLAGVAVAGGLLAAVLLLARAGFRLANVPDEKMPRVFQPGAPMPYAVAIAGGTIWWGWKTWPLG